MGEENPNRIHLYVSAFILNLNYFIAGMGFAWSSPVLLKLSLSETDSSAVASSLSLGVVLGTFITAVLLDRLGRKGTVGVSLSLATSSVLFLTFGKSVEVLSFARFVYGISSGMTFSSVPIYIAEISEVSLRGSLNTLIQLFSGSGSLFIYSIGPFVSYAVLHYSILAVCLTTSFLSLFLSTSPYYLMMKNDIDGAKKSLTWLRGKNSLSLIERELRVLRTTLQQSQSRKSSIRDLFMTASNRKALIICSTLSAIPQCSGMTILSFYTQQIFQMTGTNISSSSCSIIVGAIMVISATFSPLVVKYYGYKLPLLVSALGMALGMGGLGVFFLMKSSNINVDYLNWLPLLSCVVFIIFGNFGFGNIPTAIIGELFSNEVKPLAATFVISIAGCCSFLTSNLFPSLVLQIGQGFVFMLCSFFSIFGAVFTLVIVKDTSSMSFTEIQDMLNGRKKTAESTKEMNQLKLSAQMMDSST